MSVYSKVFAKSKIIYFSGRNQPGCGTDITGNCAHGRSSEFYAASVDHSNHFVSTRFVPNTLLTILKLVESMRFYKI